MSLSDQNRVHRRLTLNSMSNMGRFVLLMAVTFFLTPFIVTTLGSEIYGFWVLLMSFLGYASILELGVQPAVVKLVGQYRAVHQNEKLKELITAALVFFISVGGVAVLFSLFALPAIVSRTVSGMESLPDSRTLYMLIALDAVVMYLNYLFTGILYGCQRYHLRNIIDVGGWALNVFLVVTLLEEGGIVALMIAKTSMDLLIVFACAIAVPRVFPELRISIGSLRVESFRELMNFGGRVFLSATTTRLASYAEPLIITTSLNAAAAAFYAIPVKLIDYARQVSWTLTASFMPMFSELQSKGSTEILRSVYMDYSRFVFTIMLPLPLLVMVYGPDFVGLWIGPTYAEEGRMVLYLLSASVLIESFQPLTWRFFIGVGHLNILVIVSAIFSVLTIVGSILLVKPLGITGVALSQTLGAVLAQCMYLLHAARYLDVPWHQLLFRVNLRPVLVGLVTYLVARLLASTLGSSSYSVIIVGSLISVLVHGSLALRLALNAGERGVLRAKFSRLLPG